MKLSELIKQMQDYIAENGDMEDVKVRGTDYFDRPILRDPEFDAYSAHEINMIEL